MELEHRLLTVPSENRETGEVTTRSLLQPMLRATYVLAHESGESISYRREWPAVEQKGRPIDKAEGGALTTALGYAIRDVLCLPRDDQYADMDRRDDRDHEPQRQQPQTPRAPERTAEPPPAEQRREAASLADSGKSWDDLLAAAKRGEPVAGKLEGSALNADGRTAITFVHRAWNLTDSESDFGKLGAEVKASALSPAWKDIVFAELKAAWLAFKDRQGRLARVA